ncbi:MAG: HEAT repeat domain-containing protein [Endomicrobiia bacterium]|nr:HEAT repeat domain-containing protein [Endomicrobiia bacterium]
MRKTLLALMILAAPATDGLLAQQTKITPDLAASLENAKPHDQIRVIALMSAKFSFRPFSVSIAEQREQIRLQRIEELKKFSSSDQSSVADFLLKAVSEKKASAIRSNLVKNLVSFRAAPDVIRELDRRDDVALVFPYDEAKFSDETVTDAELNIVDYTRDFAAAFKRLSDANPMARRNAILFLSRENTAETLKAIAGVLYDDDVLVRRTAVEAVGRFQGSAQARQAVAEFLKKETDVAAKISAIRAAGELGGQSSVEILKKLAADPYAIYRAEAVKALGKINPAGGLSAVMTSAVSDEAEGVRIAAMDVAGRLQIKSLMTQVRANLSDTSPIVRRSAAWSLGQMGDSAEIDLLLKAAAADSEDFVRVEAANSVEIIRSRIKSRSK